VVVRWEKREGGEKSVGLEGGEVHGQGSSGQSGIFRNINGASKLRLSTLSDPCRRSCCSAAGAPADAREWWWSSREQTNHELVAAHAHVNFETSIGTIPLDS
jgi:hypothetical protein